MVSMVSENWKRHEKKWITQVVNEKKGVTVKTEQIQTNQRKEQGTRILQEIAKSS